MIDSLGRHVRRPLALVVALLSLTLVVGTPVNANAAVRTPSHTVLKSDNGTMKSYVHGTASRGPGKDLHRVKYGVALPVKRGSVANVGNFGSGSRMPTSAALGSCDVLNLVLGPLDLNLLGLKVHLDKVVLNVTAVAGAGNLLGNLLCAVAGLLDGTGVLGQVSSLLQQILAVLNQ